MSIESMNIPNPRERTFAVRHGQQPAASSLILLPGPKRTSRYIHGCIVGVTRHPSMGVARTDLEVDTIWEFGGMIVKGPGQDDS